jgi:hypothetical protein
MALTTLLMMSAVVAATRSLLAIGPVADRSWPHRPVIMSAYTGSAGKGVAGLQRWEAWSGVDAPLALDFAGGDSWSNIDGPGWLLQPWSESGRRLVYSLPMFPQTDTAATRASTLAECAAGTYDNHWAKLGRQLMTYHLSSTIVRPGWEANGDWYDWSAIGRERDYIGCFRHIVTELRNTPGQAFEFVWNPSVGTHRGVAAADSYPGDAYVDYIGVDVYDVSWQPRTYPVADRGGEAQRDAAQQRTWQNILNGPEGLLHWARFAAGHAKFLAIPEWGLSDRSDGHGGGDNPFFVERMLTFIRDPAHHVAFALYFDANASVGGSGTSGDDATGDGAGAVKGYDRHSLSATTSPFPQARDRFLNLARGPGPG